VFVWLAMIEAGRHFGSHALRNVAVSIPVMGSRTIIGVAPKLYNIGFNRVDITIRLSRPLHRIDDIRPPRRPTGTARHTPTVIVVGPRQRRFEITAATESYAVAVELVMRDQLLVIAIAAASDRNGTIAVLYHINRVAPSLPVAANRNIGTECQRRIS